MVFWGGQLQFSRNERQILSPREAECAVILARSKVSNIEQGLSPVVLIPL